MEVLPMDIEWFRDLVICIWGLVATGVVIFLAVLAYSFYHRSRSVLDSMEAVSNRAASVLNSIEGISTTVEEVVAYVGNEVAKPVVQAIALVQGIRQGIDMINSFFKKQEGGRDD